MDGVGEDIDPPQRLPRTIPERAFTKLCPRRDDALYLCHRLGVRRSAGLVISIS